MKSKFQTVGFVILIIFSVLILLLNIMPKGIAALSPIIVTVEKQHINEHFK